MSIRPHLSLILETLERDVRPDVTSSHARGAITAISRILRRMIVNIEGGDDLDTPNAFFGGSAARRDLNQEADAKLNAETGAGFAWARDMVRWEKDRYDIVAARLESLKVEGTAAFGAMDPVDPARLEGYLRTRLKAPNLKIAAFNTLSGGHSKQTAAFEVENCADLPRKLILRMERLSGVMPPSINREFPIFDLLHRNGVTVPQPFLVEESKEPIGGAFLVLAALRGEAGIGSFLNPPKRPALALQVARELGKVHALKGAQLAPVAKLLKRATADDMRQELDHMEKSWKKFRAPFSVAGPFALKWMRRNFHLSEGEERMIHTDLDFHNVLADGDTLTALLDWETAMIGNPAYDLGYIRWSIEKLVPWSAFIAEYEKAGGVKVAPEQVDFYALWGIMRLAGPLMTQCRQMIEDGTTRQIDYAVVAIDILQRCMHRMASDLARVDVS